MRIPVRDFH